MAKGRQLHTCRHGGVPNMHVASYPDGLLPVGQQESHVKNCGTRFHLPIVRALQEYAISCLTQKDQTGETGGCLRIVKLGVLAVRGVARFAAAEVARRNHLRVAFPRQQFDKPSLVLDFFVQDTAMSYVRGSLPNVTSQTRSSFE